SLPSVILRTGSSVRLAHRRAKPVVLPSRRRDWVPFRPPSNPATRAATRPAVAGWCTGSARPSPHDPVDWDRSPPSYVPTWGSGRSFGLVADFAARVQPAPAPRILHPVRPLAAGRVRAPPAPVLHCIRVILPRYVLVTCDPAVPISFDFIRRGVVCVGFPPISAGVQVECMPSAPVAPIVGVVNRSADLLRPKYWHRPVPPPVPVVAVLGP